MLSTQTLITIAVLFAACFATTAAVSKRICGTNSNDEVYCATENDGVATGWARQPGLLTQITVHGDEMFGVNKHDSVYYKKIDDSEWQKLDSKLRQVSYDGTTLCGVNADDTVYCATENMKTAGQRPKWEILPGKLTHVVVKGKTLYGVNKNDNVYVMQDYGILNDIYRSPDWVKLNGLLRQISFDGKTLCGVSKGKDAYCAQAGTGTLEWKKIGSKMKHIQVEGSELFGTDNDDTPLLSAYPAVEWKKLTGKLSKISFAPLENVQTIFRQ